jgi:hypothetical protein
MRPDMVVVVSPRRDDLARFAETQDTCSLRHSSRSLLLKLSMNAFLHRLAGLDLVPGDPIDGPAQHRDTRH